MPKPFDDVTALENARFTAASYWPRLTSTQREAIARDLCLVRAEPDVHTFDVAAALLSSRVRPASMASYADTLLAQERRHARAMARKLAR